MIASGYSMDVYCDSEESCKGKDVFGVANAQFYGETRGEVTRMARKKGWRITRNWEAFCPACNGTVRPRCATK